MAKKRSVKKLTIREFASLIYGDGNWRIRGLKRSNLPGLEMHDGPLGLRVGEAGAEPNNNAIPLAKSTCYPSPALLASSFDRDLLRRIGNSFALSCRDVHTDVLLGPGCNIKRNPLCGRNFEYYSEDPLVSGEMAAAFIEGIQKKGVGACLKHYACNSQEYYRMVNDSIVDERALHEIYLKPFEIAVKKSHPWMVMASYNMINGVYACDNAELLNEVLRGKFGFDGVVVSDWGATSDYIYNHENGLDIEMPGNVNRQNDLIYALKRKAISKKTMEESGKRIQELLQKAKEGRKLKVEEYSAAEAHELCREAVEKSAVLLKNDGMLPLKNYKKCCIIGELAERMNLNGGGSSIVNPVHPVSFLDAARNAFPDIAFAEGYRLDGVYESTLAIEAIDLASNYDNVILFLGLNPGEESEGYDRDNLSLPDEQIRLFSQLYDVNQNIIVVLNCGAPVELPFRDQAKAILLCYLPGEAGGEALHNLLTGVACPSGKLAETWPIHLADVPSFGFYPGSQLQSLYRESLYVGYRFYVTIGRPMAYPFGHGLSYARIGYGDVSISQTNIKEGDIVKLSVEVINRSKFPCEHVVQIYLNPKKQNVFKPERFLVAFQKVALNPESRTKVTFQFDYETFAHYDKASKSTKVEGGEYLFEIGNSCVDIVALKKVEVVSKDSFPSLQYSLPVYYNPGRDGFLSYDNDFEALLGHSVPLRHDSRIRPYTKNSTISDISATPVGKMLLRKAYSVLSFSGRDARMIQAGLMELPLRNLAMNGISNRKICFLVRWLNGRYVTAILTFLFGPRILHKRKTKE